MKDFPRQTNSILDMEIKYNIQKIDFGTPDYDQSIWLRTKELRIPLSLEFTEQELSEEWNQIHLGVFDLNHNIVAILVFKIIDNSTLKMRQVAVLGKLKGKGIGKELVSYAESWAKNNGFARIELHAREQAVPFYEKLKYKKVGKKFLEVNIPHYKMTKTKF